MPNTDTQVYTTAEWPIPRDSFNFYYGARLTLDTMAGQYQTQVTYTAIGENVPAPVPTTMQEMATSSYCATIPVPAYTTTDWSSYTLTLTDTRDNQNYRVRKLPDGKCWMIDNLKLGNTGTDLTLTPADSDVTTSFILPANAMTTANERITNGRCDSGVASGAGGYLTCNGTTTQNSTNSSFAAYTDPNALAACQTTHSGIDSQSTTACGYLYNWYTATAGSGTYDVSTNGTNATDSICPVGWRLPKAGTGIADANNDFAILNGAMQNGGGPSMDWSYFTNWQPTGSFSGSYSGSWWSGFNYQGSEGFYWSSSVNSAAYARYLVFYSGRVYPGSYGDYKFYGFAVRCVL